MMIEELQLYTTRMEDLKHFYRDTLGMEVSNATDQAFNLQVGRTKMIFKPCETDREPFIMWPGRFRRIGSRKRSSGLHHVLF